MTMSANRAKADTSPRIPVGQAIAFWGTYTVNEEAKTYTNKIEHCTFPQWDGGGGTASIAFPTEDEFHFTFTTFSRSIAGGAYRPPPDIQASEVGLIMADRINAVGSSKRPGHRKPDPRLCVRCAPGATGGLLIDWQGNEAG